MATPLNKRPHVQVILDERDLTYGCKKGERVIAGGHRGKGCPGIVLSGLTVPGRWQRAFSVPRGECNLHVECCNQEQTTRLYKLFCFLVFACKNITSVGHSQPSANSYEYVLWTSAGESKMEKMGLLSSGTHKRDT